MPEADRSRVLWWAVAATVLCFLPLGVVAVVLAMRAEAAARTGDESLAARRSLVARRFAIAALVVGLVVDLAILAVLALLGAF